MKIGVLLCAYQCEEHLEKVLAPWTEAQRLHQIGIAAVSGLFKEYQNMSFDKDNEKTLSMLGSFVENGTIECLFSPLPSSGKSESEVRNLPLQHLLYREYDFIWLLDGDEYYTVEQISKIIAYIEAKPFIDWFGINFKNYVFDGNVWIDGFCPPRIFRRVTSQGYKIVNFYWDNDIMYKPADNWSPIKKYTELSTVNISKSVAHVKHMTWISNEKSKRKVEYQLAHFGHCSYKWNEEFKKLEFDKSFYQKYSIPMPKLQST